MHVLLRTDYFPSLCFISIFDVDVGELWVLLAFLTRAARVLSRYKSLQVGETKVGMKTIKLQVKVAFRSLSADLQRGFPGPDLE